MSSILTTLFFCFVFSRMKVSRELFVFLLVLHVIIPIDLLLFQKKVPYNLNTEFKLFLIYNVFLYVVFGKTFGDVYFRDLPMKYERHPNMKIREFLETSKLF